MSRLVKFGLLVLSSLTFCLALPAGPPDGVTPDEHLVMGNPSGANATDKNNFLLPKKYFTLSYNSSKASPNWVSWHLTKKQLGAVKRAPGFKPDKGLPAGFIKLVHKDYTGSGFDRGHMCPHSDRNLDKDMNDSTFVMTNIVAQSHDLNANAWNGLEIYCRDLVENEGKELYIVCGPAGQGGRGKNGFENTIADGKVVVPAHCWKVIMVLDANDGKGSDVRG